MAACTREISTPVSTTTCKLNLNIFIRQGPNTEQTFSGQVVLGGNTGLKFQGDFIEDDRTPHPISLALDDIVIHFTLEQPQGRIYGTGMMESNLADCSGTGGGTLSGPALGDLGDWRGQWIKEVKAIKPAQARV